MAERRVPKFELTFTLGNVDRPTLNRLQRSFYLRDFTPGFLAGDPVDVNGQPGYASVMFYELAERIDVDPTVLTEIRRLADTYGEGIPNGLPYRTVADTYFLEGDFAAGYKAYSHYPKLHLYLALTDHLGHLPVAAIDVFSWMERDPDRRIANTQEMFDRLTHTLDEFHEEHGISVIEEFWRRVNVDAPIEEVAQAIEDDIIKHINGEQLRAILATVHDPEYPRAIPSAFTGTEVSRPVEWPAPWILNDPRHLLVRAKCRQLFRDAENAQRAAEGLPEVGKGWVSEATLLRELERAFPAERIIHQWRPTWLGSQSLDIAFPHRHVAVEYQGAQHSRPVEFFGGAEAFEAQRWRDERKRELCATNGFALIEVHPGYDIDDVVERVRAALNL